MFKTTYVYDYSCTRLHMFKTTSAYDYICTRLHMYKITSVYDYSCTKLHMFKTTYVYNYSCTRLHMFKITSAYDYSCTKLHLYKTTYEKIKTLAFICNTSTSRICPTNRVEPAQLHFLSRLNQCLFRVSSKGSYQCLFTFSAHINVFSHFRLISMSFDIFESRQKTLISMSLTH